MDEGNFPPSRKESDTAGSRARFGLVQRLFRPRADRVVRQGLAFLHDRSGALHESAHRALAGQQRHPIKIAFYDDSHSAIWRQTVDDIRLCACVRQERKRRCIAAISSHQAQKRRTIRRASADHFPRAACLCAVTREGGCVVSAGEGLCDGGGERLAYEASVHTMDLRGRWVPTVD